MFVQDSAPLPIPVTLARDRLLAYLHDDARLQPDTWHASEQGATLLRCPGVTGVATRVTAHTGPARQRGVSTVIPIWWTSTGTPVPALDLTLELDPRPDGTSQLTLCGRYLPPLTRNSVPVEHLVIGPAALSGSIHPRHRHTHRTHRAQLPRRQPRQTLTDEPRHRERNQPTLPDRRPAPPLARRHTPPRRLTVQLTSGQRTTRCPADGGVIQAVSARDSRMLTVEHDRARRSGRATRPAAPAEHDKRGVQVSITPGTELEMLVTRLAAP